MQSGQLFVLILLFSYHPSCFTWNVLAVSGQRTEQIWVWCISVCVVLSW